MTTTLVLSMSQKKVDMESALEDASVNGAQHLGLNTVYYTDLVGGDMVG